MGQQQLGILADRALPHRGQWEWQWRGATGQRAEDALLVDLGASFRERQELGVLDAGRGVARNLDRPSRPASPGAREAPAPTQSLGTLELMWGFPRRATQQGTYTTPHRRRVLVVLRTSTWEMGAIAMYIPWEMV